MTARCPEACWPGTEDFLAGFLDRAERLRVPLSGSLELTRRCNLDCVHCYLGARDHRQEQRDREMGTARVLALIDEMTAAGCMNLLITGGEPLLREDFADVYRRAKQRGLLVTLFTNGTTIGERIVELFCELPPVEVEISLYGATAEVHERITRVPGSYEACLRGVRALLARGVRVNLKTILMTINRHELPAMEGLARDFGVGFRFDAAISPGIDGDTTPLGFRVTPEVAVAEEMSDSDRELSWKKFYEKFQGRTLGPDLYGCGAGLTAFHIDPFGNLLPCMMTPDMGYDTSETGFASVWQNNIAHIRDRVARADFACARCDKINVCGYCPGFFRLEHGREDVRSEYLCRMGTLRYRHIQERLLQGGHDGRQQESG